MIGRTILAGRVFLTVGIVSVSLLSQQATVPSTAHPAAPASSSASAGYLAGVEFPVLMQQNVVAGKTPVGTRVQAKLVAATLVKGVVVPQDAIFDGEITESAAISSAEASRLAIRIDSAHWKNGSLPINVYLTAWYYPVAAPMPHASTDQRRGVQGSVQLGATSRYPANPPSFPGTGDDDDTAPNVPGMTLSKHRMQMKDVESNNDKDLGVVLTSKRNNIKLDKSTTYVLATTNLGATGS
jgi:hypothetical protein